MNIREKRLRDLRNKLSRYEAQREAAIKTLVRVELIIPGLRKMIRRYELLLQSATQVVESPRLTQVEPPKPKDDDIPTFLDVKAKDEAAKAAVQAEVDAEKKRKADLAAEKRAIKKEVVQAELTGARRKMPLTGKDALAALGKLIG